MSVRKKKKIVFVCTGNTCRSPMAQFLMTEYLQRTGILGYEVLSAGIAAKKGDKINPKSALVLSENGISADGFSSVLLKEKLLVDAFAVICMTERQKEYLTDMRWNALRKAGRTDTEEVENNVYSFAELTGYEILDPYGKDTDCYRYVYGLLSAGMTSVAEKLNLRTLSQPAPKKRGRPKKQVEKGEETKVPSTPKKRGRPKKAAKNVQMEINL